MNGQSAETVEVVATMGAVEIAMIEDVGVDRHSAANVQTEDGILTAARLAGTRLPPHRMSNSMNQKGCG